MKSKTIKLDRVKSALQKAVQVGTVEENVVIDGCSLVVRNLTAPEQADSQREIAELDGNDYVFAMQLEQTCRAVVEINGVDLRDVDFIEEEVPVGEYLLQTTVKSAAAAEQASKLLGDVGLAATVIPPTVEDGSRVLNVARHVWIRDLLTKWGAESLYMLWRKCSEAIVLAEERAKEQVVFKIPDETDADKFRRLLTEAKALEERLPVDLSNKIINDCGYLPASTEEEKAAILQSAKEFAEEQARLKAQESLEDVLAKPLAGPSGPDDSALLTHSVTPSMASGTVP